MYLPIVKPVVQWNINETVVLNGNTSGSCTAIGNPRPLPVVSNQCISHTNLTVIDNYTVTVEFDLSHITAECQDIYCFTSTYRVPDLRSLNIIGNLSVFMLNN